MRRPARITVLCEDLQQATFVRRFLMRRGWTRHDLREEIHTPGQGAGEQAVRKRFPRELRAYRSKCNHLHNALILVVDADTRTPKVRADQLDQACREAGIEPRQKDERVLFAIPKRNIETWLAYLRGETVNERDAYRKYISQSDCHPNVNRLDRMCQDGRLEGSPPPSLEQCCSDFRRFWRLIRGA